MIDTKLAGAVAMAIAFALSPAQAQETAVSPAIDASQSTGEETAEDEIIVVEGEIDPMDKEICGYERPTGSNFPKKVCRTRRQIEQDRELAIRFKDELDRLRQAADMTALARPSE